MSDRQTYARGGSLCILLDMMRRADAESPPDYGNRNRMALLAISSAVVENVPVGIRIDPAEPEWPVLYFELPTGQVSWHLPQHDRPGDGHDNEVKAERIRAYLAGDDLRPADAPQEAERNG